MLSRIPIILAFGVALGLTLAAGPTLAENWYPYYMVPSGVAYLDKDSIIYRPGHVTARIESTYPEPKTIVREGKAYSFTMTKDLVDVDCNANVFIYVGRDLYDSTGLHQLTINTSDEPYRIQRGTPEEVLARSLCRLTPKR